MRGPNLHGPTEAASGGPSCVRLRCPPFGAAGWHCNRCPPSQGEPTNSLDGRWCPTAPANAHFAALHPRRTEVRVGRAAESSFHGNCPLFKANRLKRLWHERWQFWGKMCRLPGSRETPQSRLSAVRGRKSRRRSDSRSTPPRRARCCSRFPVTRVRRLRGSCRCGRRGSGLG